MLFDQVIEQDDKLFVTFIDYTAAFDSVSHKYLDMSLKHVGALRKTRAIFRAIYMAAEGTARVRGLHGDKVYSAEFKVRRGVIQGDIISPIFFILAMEQIFRVHDPSPSGVNVDNYLHIGVLGYADDAALVSRSTHLMSNRLTKISNGSAEDADMKIHTGKTKNMIVERQQKISPPSIQCIKATEAEYKHVCKFCGRRCKTNRGLKIHMASCDKWHGLTDEEFEIDEINAVFGTPSDRWYRVSWSQHPGEDSWEPENSLVDQGCQEAIKDFWLSSEHSPNKEFIADPDGIWRYWTCGRGYKSSRQNAESTHHQNT